MFHHPHRQNDGMKYSRELSLFNAAAERGVIGLRLWLPGPSADREWRGFPVAGRLKLAYKMSRGAPDEPWL